MMKNVFRISWNLPLIGHIAFGLIDRGTNLIQVRPFTGCPLSCIFCSVDAGPFSRNRVTEYIVDHKYILYWFKKIARYKNVNRLQAYIDGVGDPAGYPSLIELIRGLNKVPYVSYTILESRGVFLNKKLIDGLNEAGLERINLSIDTLDEGKARFLTNTPWYNVNKIIELAKYIVENTSIDLLIAPIWIPGINDKDIFEIIDFALNIGAGKRCPPLGIQKYEVHKYGRKIKNIRPLSWKNFYKKLEEWEKIYGIKLILKPEDLGIFKTRSLPKKFKIGERSFLKIVGPGWLKNEWLAMGRERVITIFSRRHGTIPINSMVLAEIIENKHNIYLAKILK